HWLRWQRSWHLKKTGSELRGGRGSLPPLEVKEQVLQAVEQAAGEGARKGGGQPPCRLECSHDPSLETPRNCRSA
ncbi:MAG: hypothetical protein KAJ98_00350, partial [Spirochaetaceae bacterium]|nr:hypothetical protein [Spirochaetaceae bacterium]